MQYKITTKVNYSMNPCVGFFTNIDTNTLPSCPSIKEYTMLLEDDLTEYTDHKDKISNLVNIDILLSLATGKTYFFSKIGILYA
ncbi:hypothetical protein [Vibrio cholerae]|uniref:hypothetical protein n=1 Tax=Vibrio cholerae TaxID=666 RepID=UPI0020860FB3|nr:hypothetical protein [Vibrio cholerae]MEB5518166.1 hypothetical protein [Vibrio cholerae]GIB53953.1 hypothetical protein VCSRO187_3656 [Vibrio cholerae]